MSSEKDVPIVEEREVKKPAARFRWRVVDVHSPPEIYNATLFFTVFVFGILGAARGYDEGNIAGSIYQKSFTHLFGLADKSKTADQLANLKSNITSMVQLGSVGGALLAMFTVDTFGRVRALQGVCILWIVGAIIQITSKHVGQLYAGRLIEGLAIGQTTTIGPTFMAEVAPPAYRGLFGCLFSGAVYFGVFVAYGANYGTAKHLSPTSNNQWVIPTSVKIILAGLVFIGSLFCVESPRWLLMKDKTDKALKNLCRLRRLSEDHPYIVSEIADVQEQVLLEREANRNYPIWKKLRDIVMIKSIRYRFFAIGACAQILGQWSGANAITIYATDLFGFVGIRGIEVMKMTLFVGLVKFVSAYLSAFFIIDFLGRRKALYIGIVIQSVTMLFFAIFLQIVPQATQADADLTASQKNAAKAAMAAIYISGVGWTMGFNSVQYLLGSEIFPLGIRSFAQSLVMVLHFANQYGNSKALPKMMLAMNNAGAFFFFFAVGIIALFWSWFFIPEVSGRSLESMDEVFNLPWYLIGRKGAILCPDRSEINKITYTDDGPVMLMPDPKPNEEYVESIQSSQKSLV